MGTKKEFYLRGDRIAWWGTLGDPGEMILNHNLLKLEDIPGFIEWLQKGPPKPQYRITKVFVAKPVRVTTGWGDGERYHHLKDADIEEVPCSG